MKALMALVTGTATSNKKLFTEVEDICGAAKWRGKYPPLFTDTEMF